jgi:uncharacterized protein YeaO (DUF488 family)
VADSGRRRRDLVVKRIYDPIGTSDGQRVLVDRIWPRGVGRDAAALDAWLPAVAPSTELRKWFDHRADRWEGFTRRYREELVANPAVDELHDRLRRGRVTLLYSARDTEHNQAVALAAFLTATP